MKLLTAFLILSIFGIPVFAQPADFPVSWEGNWKGDLKIYAAKSSEPEMQIPMELRIQPKNDSVWHWEIHYLTENPDIRKYELIRDLKSNQWKIDEKNGIILPQTFMGNRMQSVFSLDKTLLIATYWLENGLLNFEIIITQTAAESNTGLGDETSPYVGNHPLIGYHKAVLKRNDSGN